MNVLKIRLGLLCLVMFASAFTFNLKAQCNCSNSVTNPTTTSEFGTTTTVTGYCKKITGTFTIDHNMEFINSNLDMQPGSQIIINSGVSLKFTGTNANNCSSWKGILFTDNTSTFEAFSNSSISGASNALEAPNGGIISINDSKLLNNIYSIYAKNRLSINLVNIDLIRNTSSVNGIFIDNPMNSTLNISNSRFSGGNSLSLNIKDGTLNALIESNCLFDGGHGAIQMKNIIGTKVIKNSRFINATGYTIDFWGGNGGSVLQDTFEYCKGAVLVHDNENGAINVNNNYIANQTLGIWVYLNKSTAPTTINSNKFDNIDSIGLVCNGIAMGVNPITNINDNSLSYCHKGFLFENYTNATVVSNIFTLIRSKGIILNNTNNCSFTFNNLSANALAITEGFDLDMSMGNNINCNNTNYTYRGFHSNNTCGSTRLFNNYYGHHNTGLKIEFQSYIGVQYHHYNIWLDTAQYSNLGAENLNTNQILIDGSKFWVSTPMNTSLNPSNSGSDFFKYDPLPTIWSLFKECQQTAPEDEERNSNLKLMIYPYNNVTTPEEKANTWESNRYVYQELKQHPNYQLQDATLASFVTSQANSNINSFYEIVKAISEGRYNDANSINSTIVTSELYEENLKQVYNLFLQPSTLSANQITTLLGIANQCPSSGGSAVFIARAMYRQQVNPAVSFDQINCEIIQNRENHREISDSYTIVPNPTNNTIQILNYLQNEDAKLEIINSQGIIVKSIDNFNSINHNIIDIHDLSSGLYIVRLSKGFKTIINSKFIKID